MILEAIWQRIIALSNPRENLSDLHARFCEVSHASRVAFVLLEGTDPCTSRIPSRAALTQPLVTIFNHVKAQYETLGIFFHQIACQ